MYKNEKVNFLKIIKPFFVDQNLKENYREIIIIDTLSKQTI